MIFLDRLQNEWRIVQRDIIKINTRTNPYLIKHRLYNYLLSPSRVPCPPNYPSIGDRPLRWTGFLGGAKSGKLHYSRIHEKCQIAARRQPWPGLTGSWLAGSLSFFFSLPISSLTEDIPAWTSLLSYKKKMSIALSLMHETNVNYEISIYNTSDFYDM